MKHLLPVFLFLFLVPVLSFAQDTIVKKGGTLRICKVSKQDHEKVYFTFEQDGEKVSKFLRKADIEAIKYEAFMSLDTIIKNDGVVRICQIQKEDSANVYVSIKLEGKKTDAFVKKTNIQSIKPGRMIPRKPNEYFTAPGSETISK